MAASQHYFMKWNNYQSHISNIFLQLYQTETLVDVTVCADGVKLQAHRVILSACSPYFQDILADAGPNPILLLHDISSSDMKSILDFIYRGELNVASHRTSSLLRAANSLQISGLMEVSKHLPDLEAEKENVSKPNGNNQGENLDNFFDMNAMKTEDQEADTSTQMEVVEIYTDVNEQSNLSNPPPEGDVQIVINTDSDMIREAKKKRAETKKEYSEQLLAEALTELHQGKTLADVCSRYAIPRSTLYSRARVMGIAPTIERKEYSAENVAAAIQAVAEGASLKHASETWGIPKTVLWRKVQRDGGKASLRRRMRKYTPAVMDLACNALLSGHSITRVANQFKIPTSTLFREKQRLVKEGKLPARSINTKKTHSLIQKIRLDQAVAACQDGKMSQALASQTFQVPKTTIWRRLQRSAGNNGSSKQERRRRNQVAMLKADFLDGSSDDVATAITSDTGEEFTFSEVVPMTYLNVGEGGEVNEHSLIILTPSNETLDLQQNVVVEEEITEISAEDAQAEEDEQNQDQEATVMDHSILGIDCS
nr:PREDICTED: uncharacterized protein LOC109037934 isoform X1 [Bemisia tabaci]